MAANTRVSTSEEQSAKPQLLDLRKYASQRGWKIAGEYVDEAVSGTKSSRPALNRLMDDGKKRRFDIVLVWRFDRFARSTRHLLISLEEFRDVGIDFVSFQESIDTTSPLGMAVFTIVSAVAQLERDIIAERVKAGLRKAKAEGKELGPPKADIDAERLREMAEKGMSLRQMARLLKVGKSTVARKLKRLGQRQSGTLG
ncbi:MAG TPA: recombinase family protein [Acidobacteriota bacterium]|nr:recombinase family protein [Acidobacteriota bacterium]